MVAEGSFCRKDFLDLVASEGLATRTIFVSDDQTRSSMTAQLATGRSFVVVDGEEVASNLRQEVFRLAMPRSETRIAISDLELRFTLAGHDMQGEIVDISNQGCAVRLPFFGGRAPVPGTSLEALAVVRGRRVIVDDIGGVVRHLGHDRASNGFRLGIEFLTRAASSQPPVREVITEKPAHVAAMFEALAGIEGAMSFVCVGEDGEILRATLDDFAPETKMLKVRGSPARQLESGDVLQGSFECDGTQHQFWTAVRDAQADAVIVGLPRTIVSKRNRGVQRFRPSEDAPVQITVRSPLSVRSVTANALDITASSVSFPISRQSDLFPVGTRVQGLELTFANGDSFRVDGQVRRISKHSDASEGHSLRCVVEFIDGAQHDLGELAARIALASLPEVSTDEGATCEQIWRFLEESGFLYPAKLAHLDVVAAKKTMNRLIGTPNEVAKAWLVRQDRQIVAHLSSVRLFSSTWGLQHLAATSHKAGGSWASMLNLALAEYCEQHPKIEWLRVAYRPNNQWPHHVFGRFAHRVNDPNVSDFRILAYMTSLTGVGIRKPNKHRYEIRKFKLPDLGALEACLVAEGRSILLSSADVSRERIDMREVTDSFDGLGLTRRREILVAERAGKPAGFALLEISSPGLNLSELTNAATIYCLEHDGELIRALGDAARQRYGQLGYTNCILLTDEQSSEHLAGIGFVKTKEYCHWIWHFTLLRAFYRYVSARFP
ncbi:MAG: PilZ domain-containing protein [Myxococcales bacterium]|nr:PilZ domain-containing protein [Myxococcales bacterium]